MSVDLTPFGFTPTESAVYAVLLTQGPGTGYAIARSAGLARANAYAALEGLVAKGAAVDVAFDVVCQPYNESTTFSPDMGSWVKVDQAVSKAMTHGYTDIYGVDFVCDGVTMNMMTVRLIPESIPFKKGDALVSIRMNLVDYTTWSSQTGQTSTTLRVR